ncbi:MAG TPA: Pvc16 family protein [Chloroflexota bacterium]|nr:Pvc16 family protein [Chloroflexota bacterium]
MFADLDESIRQLLIEQVPLDPSEIEISFDTPDREWSGRLTRPTVNCFLYDVRENMKLRKIGWETRRDVANNLATRIRPPMRVDATYQITAWSRAREDEHRLLWRLMLALARFPFLPDAVLQGELRTGQPLPIPASVGQPDQMPANYADLWQALDNRIRPVLTYVVTLVLDPEITFSSPLTLKSPSVGVDGFDRRDQQRAAVVQGKVLAREDHQRALAGALVVLAETGDRVLTDAEGLFAFPNVERGKVTLIVRAQGRDEAMKSVAVPSPNYDLEV